MTSLHGNAFRITGPLWILRSPVDSPNENLQILSFDVYFIVDLNRLLTLSGIGSDLGYLTLMWHACNDLVIVKRYLIQHRLLKMG